MAVKIILILKNYFGSGQFSLASREDLLKNAFQVFAYGNRVIRSTVSFSGKLHLTQMCRSQAKLLKLWESRNERPCNFISQVGFPLLLEWPPELNDL